MKNIISSAILLATLCACQKKEETQSANSLKDSTNKVEQKLQYADKQSLKDTIGQETVREDKDFEAISYPCLIMVEADEQTRTKAMEEMQKSPDYDPENMAEAGSDADFYITDAEDFAKMQGLKFLRTTKKTLKFYKDGKIIFEYKNEVSGLNNQFLFFDAQKSPKLVENITLLSDGKEYEAYFGKKAKPMQNWGLLSL